jgi:hypothetical protein
MITRPESYGIPAKCSADVPKHVRDGTTILMALSNGQRRRTPPGGTMATHPPRAQHATSLHVRRISHGICQQATWLKYPRYPRQIWLRTDSDGPASSEPGLCCFPVPASEGIPGNGSSALIDGYEDSRVTSSDVDEEKEERVDARSTRSSTGGEERDILFSGKP